ncbi:hypothetical protein [Streptomyces sp. G1]|uniref:hypothetical protein n=1 Tax=Streptomyces sp. G1 TaxID=361572 RepID=UPI00202F0BED|nr:hypothetical protein [Streptomyces sp. G1]MCM1964844.1 hypothetical protein [Streptomyces sp. G1]
MACACGNKNKGKFQVIASNGKTVFTSGSKDTADGVAKRYPGSKVEEVGKPATAAKTDPTPAAPAAPGSTP